MSLSSTPRTSPRFELGRVFATTAAIDVLNNAEVSPTDLLTRHVCGEWGDLSECDRRQNELAVEQGERILSSFVLPGGRTVWLITESDRSATTLLLPGDY